MLYDRWQQVVRDHRGELALVEQATRQRWTFAQLDADISTIDASDPGGIVFPTGAGADFIRRTIAAWRQNRVLCPIEASAIPPILANVPAGVVHLKLTSATGGQARLVTFSADQLAADAAQIVSTMGLRAQWPNVGAISLAHSYGFSSLVLPLLLHGIPLIGIL